MFQFLCCEQTASVCIVMSFPTRVQSAHRLLAKKKLIHVHKLEFAASTPALYYIRQQKHMWLVMSRELIEGGVSGDRPRSGSGDPSLFWSKPKAQEQQAKVQTQFLWIVSNFAGIGEDGW